MDELIISNDSNVISTISEEEIYSGVESITIEDFNLPENGFAGFGAAAFGLIMSIGVAAIIRLFYSL
jgi:hypothetical protein